MDMGVLLRWVQDAVHAHSSIIPAILWSLWVARNKLIFDNETQPTHMLPSGIFSLIQSITRAFEWVPASNPILRPAREVAWQGAPDEHTVVLNVDGSY